MKSGLLVLALCVSVAVSLVPHERIAKIFKDFDANHNENVSEVEVVAFFTKYKNSASDKFVLKATFVTRWMKNYGDSHFVSEALYDKVDINKDGLLTDADIPLFYRLVDKNRNGIEWPEFEKVYIDWYTELE